MVIEHRFSWFYKNERSLRQQASIFFIIGSPNGNASTQKLLANDSAVSKLNQNVLVCVKFDTNDTKLANK